MADDGPIDIPFEMPQAKPLQYADLGPSRKFEEGASIEGGTAMQQPINEEEFNAALKRFKDRPVPPHLRIKDPGSRERCGICVHFKEGECEMYANYPVTPQQVCDSFKEDEDF